MQNNSSGAYSVVLIISRRLSCDLLAGELGKNEVFRVVGAETEPALGIDLVSRHRPHVAIVDATLPDNGAFKCLDALTSPPRHSRALVLGSGIYLSQVQQALCLGASGFFTFDDSLAEFVDGIGAVGDGRQAFSRRLADFISVTPRGPRLSPRGLPSQCAHLTNRELDVLACLVNGDTVRTCAKLLDISESTVDNHKTRIMRKLNIHRTVDLVKFALRERLIAED